MQETLVTNVKQQLRTKTFIKQQYEILMIKNVRHAFNLGPHIVSPRRSATISSKEKIISN